MTHHWRALCLFSAVMGGWKPFCVGPLLVNKGKQKCMFKEENMGTWKRRTSMTCWCCWLQAVSTWASGKRDVASPRPPEEGSCCRSGAAVFHSTLARDSLQPPYFTILCKLWGPAGWKCSLFRSGAVAFGFYSPKITSRWSRAHIIAQKPHGSRAGKGSRELLK